MTERTAAVVAVFSFLYEPMARNTLTTGLQILSF